jgi:tetratricopeptide (TPR) repeat protein
LQHPDEVHAVLMTADGCHALTAGRDRAAALYVWDLTTGKLLAPPLRFPATVQSLALAPDGTRVFAAYGESVALIPLAALLAEPDLPTASLRLLAELASAQRIEAGDVSGLTLEQWLERWDRFRQQHPPFHQPTLTEALSRSTAHRQAAQQLVENGQPTEALLRWRQALLEIGTAGSESERQALRAEIVTEASTLLEKVLAAQPNSSLAESLADLLLGSRPAADWTVLRPTELQSVNGATLLLQPYGSITAGGKNPDHDRYTLVAPLACSTSAGSNDLREVTALRLEALPDPRLPRGGPGRSSNNGNFHLSEMRLKLLPGPEAEKPIPVRLSRAVADCSETVFRFGGVHGALDGESWTCWSIYPQVGQPHRATFQTYQPLRIDPGTRLVVELDFQQPAWQQHTLGRFRLSVTTRPHPVRDETLALIAKNQKGWTRLGAARLLREEWKEALAALRQATAAPADGTAYNSLLLVLAHEQLGQHDEALKVYEQAAPLVASNRADYLLLGLAVEVVSESIARDPRNALLWRHRARWQAWLGLPAEATADLEQAHKLEDRKRPAGLEEALVLALQGDFAGSRGDWDQASAAFRKAAELPEAPAEASSRHALLRLYLGDPDGYAKACADLQERHGKTSDPETAELVILACTLSPRGVSDPRALLALSERTKSPRLRAAVLLRCGQEDAAVKLLEKNQDHLDWLLLSLALQHLPGREEEARRFLATFQNWLDQAQKRPNASVDGQQFWNRLLWFERLQGEILRREAESFQAPKSKDQTPNSNIQTPKQQ